MASRLKEDALDSLDSLCGGRGLSRRELLTIGALGLGGMALPDLLRAEAQQGIRPSKKAIIMIYLCGAPPHQDMFDLKMDAPGGDSRRVSAD